MSILNEDGNLLCSCRSVPVCSVLAMMALSWQLGLCREQGRYKVVSGRLQGFRVCPREALA